MPIRTNMKSLAPRRERFKREIELVSGGYANPAAFPGGKCTVFPWDSITDEWLTEYARKGDRGTVLYFLVEKLCHLNGCALKDFVHGDVNTILLVARSIQNDNVINYTAACPFCRAATLETITVPDDLVPIGRKAPNYPGYDRIVLPDCRDDVDISPLRIGDEMNITTRTPEAKEQATDHVARIITGIKTVGGGEPDGIEEALKWYMALSPKDAKFLEDQQALHTPHLDLNIEHQCDECQKRFTHLLALDEDFFRSGGAANARAALEQDIQPSVGRKGTDGKPERGA
jgi:hypothetical protein